MTRSISTIAREIYDAWPKMQEVKVQPAPWGGLMEVEHPARPYVMAMMSLHKITDNYGDDDGKGIVLRFLGNAAGWRGETAKALKAELREMTK